LAAADFRKYADAHAATDDARQELLEALFEGAVRAEGVRCHPAAPPSCEPPGTIKHEEWYPINRGVWVHENCEKMKESFRLDGISVFWDEDYIEYFGVDGEWADQIDWKIRLFLEDIDREFSASATATLEIAPSGPTSTIYRTGVAGRPTSIPIVRREMRRRAANGHLLSSLTAEVRALLQWLEENHPDAAPLTQKTAANALRDEYKELRASQVSRFEN
jgi:hypothetical protein